MIDNDEVFSSTAELLKKVRETTGKSRYAFAREIGMDGSTLAKYEKGEHSMSFDRVAAVVKTAGLKFSLVPDRPEKPPYRYMDTPYQGP